MYEITKAQFHSHPVFPRLGPPSLHGYTLISKSITENDHGHIEEP